MIDVCRGPDISDALLQVEGVARRDHDVVRAVDDHDRTADLVQAVVGIVAGGGRHLSQVRRGGSGEANGGRCGE